MELLFDWFDLIAALVFALAVGLLWASRPLFECLAARRMRTSNYVVIEAYEVHLKCLKSDMEKAGWRFIKTEPSSGGASLYRFQKVSPLADNLGYLIYKGGLPDTANRKEGAELLIKVAEHGIA